MTKRIRPWALATAVATFGFFALTPTSDAVERSEATQDYLDWVSSMEETFAANPELKTRKGSGWKPFNRIKWFNEQRMLDGELPPAGARWEVWKEKVRREEGNLSRNTWFSLGPDNFGGRTLAVDFDPTNPSTVYAGSASGGVWKSTNSGTSWTPISDELPSIAIGGLAVSKTDPNIIVIGTGEGTNNIDRVGGVGILRSTDAGATWLTTSQSLPVSSGEGFHIVKCAPNGVFLAGGTDGLWRSTDDGATWDLVRNPADWYDVAWKPGSNDIVYAAKGSAGTGNGLKKSTDGGATWTGMNNGTPLGFTIGKTHIAVTADDPDAIYAIFSDINTSAATLGVYRSLDEGASFTARNTTTNIGGGQGWYNLALAADPNDVDRVFAAGVARFRSTNGASSFAVIGGGVHVDHHALEYEPGSNSNLWSGNDGGVYRSTNDGTSWSDENNGYVTYQFYDICVNNNNSTPYYIMGGTQDNGTDKWSGTTTWANGLGADGMVCNINPINGTTVYATIQLGGHRKNTNSGSGGWSTITTGLSGAGLWVTPRDQDQNAGNHLYTSTNAGIFRTTNGASNWVNVDYFPATWISISPVNGDYIWTVAGTPRYTTDDGNSWQSASAYGFGTGGATKILAHPTDLNTAFVTFSGYGAVSHIAMTTDLGATWTDVSGDFPPQPVNAIVVNPSEPTQWFIGTDVGVWQSVNGGVNWTPFETGFANVVVGDLEIQDNLQKLVAGTHGRGAWEVDIPSLTTDVVSIDPANLALMLDAPAPNPVDSRTMLRFAAKTDAPVTLDVYDVQGRLITRVAEFERGDGMIRTTPWFADDVQSGVYFAVLRAGTLSKSQKIVVTK